MKLRTEQIETESAKAYIDGRGELLVPYTNTFESTGYVRIHMRGYELFIEHCSFPLNTDEPLPAGLRPFDGRAILEFNR